MHKTEDLKTETDPVSETLCSSVFLEYRTMDKVQKPNSPECYIPSWEPFKVYQLHVTLLLRLFDFELSSFEVFSRSLKTFVLIRVFAVCK
jgi:hypothetical protein